MVDNREGIKACGIEASGLAGRLTLCRYDRGLGTRMMRNEGAHKAGRVFIECTHLYQHNFNTGIQRVVRNLACLGGKEGRAIGLEVVPVVVTSAGLATVSPEELARDRSSAAVRAWARVRKSLIGLLPRGARATHDEIGAGERAGLAWRVLSGAKRSVVWCVLALRRLYERGLLFLRAVALHGKHVAPREGDVLLLADASWKADVLWRHASAWRARGARVGLVVYDLIPIVTPEFSANLLVAPFEKYMRRAAAETDFAVAISRHSAREFRAFAEKSGAPGWSEERAGWFRLGADESASGQTRASDDARLVMEKLGARPVYLAVGTLEVRKNHGVLLDAFDELWKRGRDVALVIIGNYGWKSQEIARRIQAHPEFEKRLFWFTKATDADLESWYRRAHTVIMASLAEGFGLPVVEALVRGRPVIASDIPTHHEIAEGFVEFFDPRRSDALVDAVERDLRGETAREVSGYRWPGWPEGVRECLNECARMAGLGKRPS
ncbi:MAG: glycosyltransferase family 4 protein [Phycisphaeraceae bacterium]|nr:glycosyltransferase family 4 protein [Phycisphaeraceae bacterium]